MLRLARLELSGFKSFYEKAELSFPGAVTAVIGPNGCGKSNICDAVAWVLGEQSAKILRGEKMDDVIFNGSGKRRPLGMAEVTLTLRSDDGDFGETGGTVAIGRRVYRDGEGEYLLNGRKVRLKDVQDILYGTGLGVRAYAIIEQGRIEQVLSAKPQDRRRLIEEAAGITKYKVRKRAAELKLEETRANLTRLSDIIGEVERACNSLKRQASKAERYKERTALLREKRGILVRRQFDRLSVQSREASALLSARRAEESESAALLAAAEAAEAESRRVSLEAQTRREESRERLGALTSAVERDDAAIELARHSEGEMLARQESLTRERAEIEGEESRGRASLAELSESLAERRRLHEEAASRRAACSGGKAELTALLADTEGGSESARAELAEAASRLAETRNARHAGDIARERAAAEHARGEKARQSLFDQLSAMAAARAQEESEAALRRSASAESAAAFARAEENLRRIEAELAQAEASRGELRERLAALAQRIEALESVIEARRRDTDRAHEALARAGREPHGLLASRLRPRPGWEAALDRLLSEELGALLVPGRPEHAADDLRRAAEGGAIVGLEWAGRREPGDWPRVIENFDALPASVAAALPDVRFAADAGEAARIAGEEPGRTIVCASGEIVRGSLWQVPLPEGAGEPGVLALSRDLEAARRDHAGAQEGLARAEASLAALQQEREESRTRLSEADEARRRADSESAAGEARLAAGRREREEREREREAIEAELSMLAAEAARLDEEASALRRREEEISALEAAAAARLAASEARAASLRGELTRAAEEEAAAREAAEGARERLASAEREIAALEEQTEAARKKLAARQAESEAISERLAATRAEAEEARRRRDENLAQREGAARDFERSASEAEAALAASAGAEEAVRERRAAFETVRQARFDAELSASRLASELEHAGSDARREFGVAPEELAAAPELTEEAEQALAAEAAELAEQIEKMGPVNVLAFEEHREQSERLAFLTAQRQDLEGSIASLLDTIRKINATCSERFAEAFARINANFAELFQRLFRGGTAEMRLLDENDILDSGIEITAQPPGKRNQSILLLSGGEKALSAIALLMAIFRYKPSPFCILDEVDAPLDEANIDRYTDLIREMSEDTQFIAITHNKRTMEKADSLYGVTMEEPGCSKIVSVRFD